MSKPKPAEEKQLKRSLPIATSQPIDDKLKTRDSLALEAELKQNVKGEVRFDAGSRAIYATDASNYRQVPIGVVVPRDAEDIIATLAAARKFGAPVVARGGGTSLAGQCCNVAIVIDMSKYYNRIIELDPVKKRARVEPGLVLDNLRNAAEQHHLTFAPDPSTHNHCTLGGMIGNDSCGVHSVMAGKTDENVEELDILTYDGFRMKVGATSEAELAAIIAAGGRRGEIYSRLKSLRDRYGDLIRSRYPDIPRRVSGYNLPYLLPEKGFHVARALVGSEGTCVTILEANLRLVYSPPVRSLLVLGYPDVYTAGDHIMEVLAAGPIGLEGLDDLLVDDMKKKGLHPDNVQILPAGKGWLLVEFGGESKAESDGRARELMSKLKQKSDAPSMKLFDDEKHEKMLWTVRESGLGATARVPGSKDTWEGWEDSAVHPARLGGYLRDLRKLFDKFGYGCSLYGHFGQGCVHTRIDFDLVTRAGIEKYRRFMDEASDLVLSYGGSLSGEHGDGQSRAELLPKMFGAELIEAFNEFKSIWDPDWRMNPGKLVRPYRMDENLRLGTSYNPEKVITHFQFPDDDGQFSRATLRCVGVGECRKQEGGTMCPSYMVTMEEEHSTRGRARLLFEMLEGEVITDLWCSDEVKDALDLCFACKGCKGECPMNVDMATYKAEFLSHYYEHHRRPVTSYSMGLIYWWARLAAKLPRLVNFFTQAPIFRDIAKLIAGVAPARKLPAFAPQTFKQWWQAREKRRGEQAQVDQQQAGERGEVMLWPDTFNNHFHPDTARAAVEVLEKLGYRVIVPMQSLCCGRPLYDYGRLDLAKKLLMEILAALRPQIRAGVPLVGLEPSCVAVFRDEMVNLLAGDEDARRLKSQTYHFSEFLAKHADELPHLDGSAIVQGHCHQKAIIKMDSEEKLLEKIGLDYQLLDSGCCGMAGAFGFEREHYDISMKAGERALLPMVRQAADDTFVIADGFSCREQIAQSTTRRALHTAQLVNLAMNGNSKRAGKPEEGIFQSYPDPHYGTVHTVAALGLAGGLLLAGVSYWKHRRQRRWYEKLF